ncbi:MAG: PAS domain-containing protein [Thalassobaculaceae bacterium]|nr:PAS domain-containing protein [Thalassobaculaceae bacterium]
MTQAIRDQMRRLLRYEPTMVIADLWLDGCASPCAHGIPGFDPLDAAPLLRHLYILERDGNRMRYRVSGESVNDLFGSNHAGKLLDSVVPPDIYPVVEGYFLDVFALKICVFKGHITQPGRSHVEFERLLLPVFRNGEIQLLGTLALSTSAKLRVEADAPPRAGTGFHFTQIDLADGAVSEAHIPLSDLPVEQLPFESHVRRRPSSPVSLGAVRKDFETIC